MLIAHTDRENDAALLKIGYNVIAETTIQRLAREREIDGGASDAKALRVEIARLTAKIKDWQDTCYELELILAKPRKS